MRSATSTLRPSDKTALDNFETDLLRLLFACAEDLPHARNGRAVAGDDYAAQVLKDITGEKSKEVRRLLAVLLDFIRRGNGSERTRARVRQFSQRLDAILASYARSIEPRPIRILNRRETREDGLFDLAQLRLEADTDDLQALEHVIQQGAFYRVALDDLMEAAQERLVVLRSGRETPARRLSLVES